MRLGLGLSLGLTHPLAQGVGYPWGAGASFGMDFVTGRYLNSSLSSVTLVRASQATDLLPSSPSGYAYSTFANNVPVITVGKGLLLQEARTQYLAAPTVPATQTTASLGTGTYVLWVSGSGTATVAAGTATGSGFGAASQGTVVVFTISVAGTVTVTVAGSLNAFQLENGAFGTSLILGSSRSADVMQFNGAAKTLANAATAAYLETSDVPLAATDPRLYAVTAGNPSFNYPSGNSGKVVSILNSAGQNGNATLGTGDITGIVKSAFGFDGTSMTAAANDGVQAVRANAWDGTSGNTYLGNIAAGSRPLNGYMRRVAFGATKGQFDAVVRARPTNDNLIAGWGNSLTQGNGSTASHDYLTVLAAALRRTSYNGGYPGQTSTQILARQGGSPALLTVTGDQIPASGAVTVTAFSVDVLIYGDGSGAQNTTGTLAGISGTLARAGGGGYTFTRTSGGSITACPAGTPFIPDVATTYRAKLQVLEMGRNNYASGAQVQADIAAAVAYLTGNYLVKSVLTAQDEGIGTGAYTTITALNAALSATYGSRFVDVTSPPTVSEMAALGYSPNAQDLIDIGNNVIPTGMRKAADVLHLNDYGYALWALREQTKVDALLL